MSLSRHSRLMGARGAPFHINPGSHSERLTWLHPLRRFQHWSRPPAFASSGFATLGASLLTPSRNICALCLGLTQASVSFPAPGQEESRTAAGPPGGRSGSPRPPAGAAAAVTPSPCEGVQGTSRRTRRPATTPSHPAPRLPGHPRLLSLCPGAQSWGPGGKGN